MGLRGPKPKGKVKIKWSPNFAYAIGLLVTDGSVSKNGRHIIFVSKDREQLDNIMEALNIRVLISCTVSGYTNRKVTRIQFSDALFSDFLVGIGVTSNKTKTIGEVKIPKKYFFDFLRGHLDGDGCVYSYFDPRWKSSFVCYTTFVSASREHIEWIRSQINEQLKIQGHISTSSRSVVYQLRYAKNDSLKLWKKLYYKGNMSLSRKRLKIEGILRTIAERQ